MPALALTDNQPKTAVFVRVRRSAPSVRRSVSQAVSGSFPGVTLSGGARHFYTYDELGRLATLNDSLLTTSRGYSARGALISETTAFTDGVSVVRRFEYNRRGQRTSVTDTAAIRADGTREDNNTYFGRNAFGAPLGATGTGGTGAETSVQAGYTGASSPSVRSLNSDPSFL